MWEMFFRSTYFAVQDLAKFEEWWESASDSLGGCGEVYVDDSGMVQLKGRGAPLPCTESEELGRAFYKKLQTHLHPDWCIVFTLVRYRHRCASMYLDAIIVTRDEVKPMNLENLAMEDPLVRDKKVVND